MVGVCKCNAHHRRADFAVRKQWKQRTNNTCADAISDICYLFYLLGTQSKRDVHEDVEVNITFRISYDNWLLVHKLNGKLFRSTNTHTHTPAVANSISTSIRRSQVHNRILLNQVLFLNIRILRLGHEQMSSDLKTVWKIPFYDNKWFDNKSQGTTEWVFEVSSGLLMNKQCWFCEIYVSTLVLLSSK